MSAAAPLSGSPSRHNWMSASCSSHLPLFFNAAAYPMSSFEPTHCPSAMRSLLFAVASISTSALRNCLPWIEPISRSPTINAPFGPSEYGDSSVGDLGIITRGALQYDAGPISLQSPPKHSRHLSASRRSACCDDRVAEFAPQSALSI